MPDSDQLGQPSLSRRLASLYKLLLAHLPPQPARVLEIGCGDGELALALARAGYGVTAIDPKAPEGTIFRSTRLEDFAPEHDFDAVVASFSLHHVTNLGAACDKIQHLLRFGGLLVLDEFAKERLTGPAAQWHYHQRHALAAVGLAEAPPDGSAETWLARWQADHADIHSSTELRAALAPRFVECYFEWGPFLFDFWLTDELEPLERELIAVGAIEATGFRYAGARR